MYKVLLVDDEILVRTNIKMLIDWGKSGYTICGEASNGKEALQKIANECPNIVITDMKMPIMDGLQLSTALAKEHPDIAIIALSNYDDFSYVRGALKNGAVDYVLKHEINPPILTKALAAAKKTSAVKKSNPLESGSVIQGPNNTAALKKEFMIQLLSGFYTDKRSILSRIQILGIHLSPSNILPILMLVDNSSTQTLKQQNLLAYGIQNISQEILNDSHSGEICSISETTFCILLSFADINSQKQINDASAAIVFRIQSTLKQFLNISANFCIGKLCNTFGNLPQIYEHIEYYCKNALLFRKNDIIYPYDNHSAVRNLSGLDAAHKEALHMAVNDLDAVKSTAVLNEVFKEIEISNLDIASAQVVFTDILELVTALYKKCGMDTIPLCDSRVSPAVILSSNDLEKIQKCFIALFNNLIAESKKKPAYTYSPYIKKAISIIKNNYSKDLSLQSTAEQIGISPAYLSTLFKTETGTKFAEFVSQYRLSKAKCLMQNGSIDIHKISLSCGFYDYVYFFKVFKKAFGITPSEYIKMQ